MHMEDSDQTGKYSGLPVENYVH